jgi:hypothetical protein
VTQPRRAQPAQFAVAAIQDAPHTALVMSVAVVALLGTNAAVAVHRTAGSQGPAAAAASPGTGGVTTPGDPLGSSAPTPTSSSLDAAAKAAQREAKTLLKLAMANALKKRSVHAVARFVTKRGTAVYDNRDALHRGVQHLTIQGGHVVIRVVGSTTYYTGDKRGLVKFFGYGRKVAAVIGPRWVPLIVGNRGYKILTEGVTLGSLLRNQRVVGPLRMLPERVIDGITAVGIQGEGAGGGVRKNSIATWWVSTGKHPLPVEFDATNRHSHLTQRFSEWGEPVHVKRPTAIFG